MTRVAAVAAAIAAVAGTVAPAVPFLAPAATDAGVLAAQPVAPKRTLTAGPAPGCPTATPNPALVSRRDAAEARRLAAEGQEAALIGDQEAARDAFRRAAALDPRDDRLAYDLGRAHAELGERAEAVTAFCRYLGLSPTGREADDVRARLATLVPSAVRQRADDAAVAFALGLGFLDDARWSEAAEAFDEVVASAPDAPEGRFNRGLARAALGRREEARDDLAAYQAVAPTVEERVAVSRALDVLRRPVYSAAGAFARGLVPGLGQVYTGRPLRGVVVMALTGAAIGAAFYERTVERTVPYVDPNGVPAPFTERLVERPYATAGAATAVGLTVAAAIEAVIAAGRSQRAGRIVAPSGADAPVTVGSWRGPDGGVGLAFRVPFGGGRGTR